MNPGDFENSPSGRCIKALPRKEAPQGYYAFVANPLPPRIDYDQHLASLLSEADRLLGELSGTGRIFPDPQLLIFPYIRREAVSSSAIEGTQSSLNDLFLFEAAHPKEPRPPDVREVFNYVQAMEYGIGRLADLPISIRLIREIHKVLLEGVRGEREAPGELRDDQNWIGPPGCSLSEATFVPPPVEEMKQSLSDWEKYLHAESGEPPLVKCALLHYQLEAIHPFRDGNGRVGRLVITFFLCEREYLSKPLLYLSAFFERYRQEYYSRLLAVSQRGDWRGWIEFFLRGVIEQAKDALADAKEILELHADYQERLGKTGKVPASAHRLIDEIFRNPVVSISTLGKKWNVKYDSIKSGVMRLTKLGILEEMTGKRRGRLFMAPALMDLLVRGARTKGEHKSAEKR